MKTWFAGTLALALVVLLVPASTARADGVVDLGTAVPSEIAVDGVHVFLAFAGLNTVQVRSNSGALVATVSNQTGAFDLTLNLDGSRLFVLLSDGHITAIDTTTLAEVNRWSMPSAICGQDIAWAGVSLFLGYSDCSSDSSSLASLDTDDPTAQPSAPFSSPRTFGASAIEGGGNVLVSYLQNVEMPDPAVTFDASTVPPTELASAPAGEVCNDAAVTSDGSEVTLACWTSLETRQTSDLAVTDSYPGSYANGQTFSVAEASGALAFQGGLSAAGPDVDVFRRGEPSPARTVTWGSSERVWHDELAFTPDGSRLFAVTRDGTASRTYLRIVTSPTLTPLRPSLSLIDRQDDVRLWRKCASHGAPRRHPRQPPGRHLRHSLQGHSTTHQERQRQHGRELRCALQSDPGDDVHSRVRRG